MRGHISRANLFVELVRQHEGEWHFLLRLVGGISEHESLVSGAYVFIRSVLVDALRNVGRLLLQPVQHRTREIVQSLVIAVIADSLNMNSKFKSFNLDALY